MANVLLLRSPSTDHGPDKYEEALRAVGYHAVSVPVLETLLVNTPELERVVEQGPQTYALGGVVVTSGRACEAWRAAVVELARTTQKAGKSIVARRWTQTERIGRGHTDWGAVPFYVVGEATTAALADIRTVAGATRLAPANIRGGAESGTSEKLAHYILQDLPATSMRKLLYLTGDKNRDVLPKILRDGGIELQTLQVYATQGSSTFAADLTQTIRSVTSGELTVTQLRV